jgi:hypothetical protein
VPEVRVCRLDQTRVIALKPAPPVGYAGASRPAAQFRQGFAQSAWQFIGLPDRVSVVLAIDFALPLCDEGTRQQRERCTRVQIQRPHWQSLFEQAASTSHARLFFVFSGHCTKQYFCGMKLTTQISYGRELSLFSYPNYPATAGRGPGANSGYRRQPPTPYHNCARQGANVRAVSLRYRKIWK